MPNMSKWALPLLMIMLQGARPACAADANKDLVDLIRKARVIPASQKLTITIDAEVAKISTTRHGKAYSEKKMKLDGLHLAKPIMDKRKDIQRVDAFFFEEKMPNRYLEVPVQRQFITSLNHGDSPDIVVKYMHVMAYRIERDQHGNLVTRAGYTQMVPIALPSVVPHSSSGFKVRTDLLQRYEDHRLKSTVTPEDTGRELKGKRTSPRQQDSTIDEDRKTHANDHSSGLAK